MPAFRLVENVRFSPLGGGTWSRSVATWATPVTSAELEPAKSREWRYGPGMGLLGSLFGGRPKVTPTSVRDLQAFGDVVLKSPVPVIVDIWSETCAPCKMLVPVLINVATKYDGRVRVVEIGTDAEPALLSRLGVRSTPTLIIYEGGQELGRQAGFRPEGWFDEMIATEFPKD